MSGGRPPKLDLIVDRVPILHPETGEPTGDLRPVTMIEHLCSDLRVGMPVHRAAKRAGITSETFYQWEKAAGRARAIRAASEDAEISDYDALCIEFSDRVNLAELEWEARSNTALEQLARGGIAQIETIIKLDSQGNQIEHRTKTTHTLPDASVLLARLKLRFPKIYSDRVIIAGEGEQGAIPVEVRAAALASAAARFQDSHPRSRRRGRRRLRSRSRGAGSPAVSEANQGDPGRSGGP